MATKNKNLTKAKKEKNDEFYTRLNDISAELNYYRDKNLLANKVILCNANDSMDSYFFKHFSLLFEKYQLKKLITISYNPDGKGQVFEFNGEMKDNMPDLTKVKIRDLKGTGDFRDEECIDILKTADIVITNPPFSLFREYVAQLVEYNKKFLIIGSINAITYKETFKLIKENKIWLGNTNPKNFIVPTTTVINKNIKEDDDGKKCQVFGNICWYTNLDYSARHEYLFLYKKYSPEEYPKYDNYNAINVNKIADIPCDYDEIIGVPISFLDKYNPEQFKIIGATESEGKGFSEGLWDENSKVTQPLVNNKKVYKRLFIKKVKVVIYND